MAFCRNCGQPMEDDSMFCPNCGTKVEDVTVANGSEETVNASVQDDNQEENVEATSEEPVVEAPVTEETVQQPVVEEPAAEESMAQQPVMQEPTMQVPPVGMPQQTMYQENQQYQQQFDAAQTPQKPKKSKKGIIIGAIAAVAVIAIALVVIFLVMGRKKTIDIMEFVEVEFDGYETAGVAYTDLDDYEFEKALLDAQGIDVEKYENIDDLSYKEIQKISEAVAKYTYSNYKLEDSIEITVEPRDDLKNGDIVTVTVSYDEEVAEQCKVKIKAEPMEITVSGLSEVEEIDPFEDLEITYSGVAPNIDIYIETNSSIDLVHYLDFEIEDEKDSYNVGDTFTVIISDSDVDYAFDNGYILTTTSKEFTVDSADEYVTTIEDIADDDLETMKEDALEVIQDSCDSYYEDDEITVGEYVYEGFYLQVRPGLDSDWYSNNVVTIVYSAEITSVEGDFEPLKVYYPVTITQVINTADGEMDFNTGSVEGYTSIESTANYYATSGYTDGTVMFQEVITDYIDSYEYTMTDGLKQFGE